MQNQGQNKQRGFDQNPYIGQNLGSNQGQRGGGGMNMGRMQNNATNQNASNPYYNTNNQMPNYNVNKQIPTQQDNSLLGAFDTSDFIKGALIGAVGAYLLTNENAQKTIFKTVAKGAEMFQSGMEEMKERFEDAKAEMESAKQ